MPTEVFLTSANEVWGKVIFLHLSVILFTGGSASVHSGISTQEQTPPPPGPGTPRSRRSPPLRADPSMQCMLGDTVNKRAVCILLECNLVGSVFAFTQCLVSFFCDSMNSCLVFVFDRSISKGNWHFDTIIYTLCMQFIKCAERTSPDFSFLRSLKLLAIFLACTIKYCHHW